MGVVECIGLRGTVLREKLSTIHSALSLISLSEARQEMREEDKNTSSIPMAHYLWTVLLVSGDEYLCRACTVDMKLPYSTRLICAFSHRIAVRLQQTT